MQRTHFLSLLLPLLVLSLASCIDISGPGANIEGTYVLQHVNGQSLPVIIYDDAEERDELLSGSITLNTNGTWSDTHTVRTTEKASGATQTHAFPDNGTYTVSGSNVQLSSSFGGTYAAVWNRNEITVDYSEPGFPLMATYRR